MSCVDCFSRIEIVYCARLHSQLIRSHSSPERWHVKVFSKKNLSRRPLIAVCLYTKRTFGFSDTAAAQTHPAVALECQ